MSEALCMHACMQRTAGLAVDVFLQLAAIVGVVCLFSKYIKQVLQHMFTTAVPTTDLSNSLALLGVTV